MTNPTLSGLIARVLTFCTPRRLMVCYVLVAIITFGVSASDMRYCPNGHDTDAQKNDCPTAVDAVNGFVAGAVWPLYWSWETADAVR